MEDQGNGVLAILLPLFPLLQPFFSPGGFSHLCHRVFKLGPVLILYKVSYSAAFLKRFFLRSVRICVLNDLGTCVSETLEKAGTVDFKKHPAQNVGTRSRQCRPRVRGRFAFPGARNPRTCSISRFGKIFPAISRDFPREPPDRPRKQPQPFRVFCLTECGKMPAFKKRIAIISFDLEASFPWGQGLRPGRLRSKKSGDLRLRC